MASEDPSSPPYPSNGNGQIYQLSRRIDETHQLIRDLARRFETHSTRTDERLDRISDVVVQVRAEQARVSGSEQATLTATDRRWRWRTHWVAVTSILATLMAAGASVMSVFHP